MSPAFLLFIALFAVAICYTNAFSIRGSFRRSGSSSRSQLAMKEFSVKVMNKKSGADNTIMVPSNKFILDAAEAQAVSIPYSCRAGSCSSCVGKLISGSVDQSSQIFLSDDQINAGFVLTCAAYATSDISIEVDIEDIFYSSGVGGLVQ